MFLQEPSIDKNYTPGKVSAAAVLITPPSWLLGSRKVSGLREPCLLTEFAFASLLLCCVVSRGALAETRRIVEQPILPRQHFPPVAKKPCRERLAATPPALACGNDLKELILVVFNAVPRYGSEGGC